MACFEDDESQTKGYVCVNFHGVTPSSPHNATVREIRMLCVSIPCKVAGVQWCQRKSILNPLERAAMNLMFWIGLTKEIRARSRIHYGMYHCSNKST